MRSRPPFSSRYLALAICAFPVSWGIAVWAKSHEGSEQIVHAMAAAQGYNGCMCNCCRSYFVGFRGFDPAPHALHREWWFGLLVAGFGCVLTVVELTRYSLAKLLAPAPRGRCVRCSYDLTGLPDSCVCPECGARPRDDS